MLVTAIETTKKGRYSIYCDGEFACALHADVFVTSGLQPGARVEPAALGELYRQSQLKITKDRALRLLSARSYTSKGLADKLSAYADEESARTVVDRMIELGLVDDLDYARRYAADCVERRGYSPRRAKQALLEKGIDRDTADQVLEERDDDPELAVAKVVLRKYLRYLEDEKGRAKTQNALLRLGYRHGDIRRVIARLEEDASYYDDWE